MQRKKTFNAFGALKASLLSVLMSFCVIAAFAQSGTVKGTVTDDTGEPVIGANVVEKGSTNGTITDIDGNYTLQVTNMNGVLQFSFIGYNTTEENIGGRTTINVQLSSGVINLGEVVAIGYGTQTRREIRVRLLPSVTVPRPAVRSPVLWQTLTRLHSTRVSPATHPICCVVR